MAVEGVDCRTLGSLGLKVDGFQPLSLHASNEPCELLQCFCHDSACIMIVFLKLLHRFWRMLQNQLYKVGWVFVRVQLRQSSQFLFTSA